MLTYLSLFVAFAGSLVGVIGSNWDGKKSGVLKLSHLGWISFLVSFLGFVSTLALTINAEQEKEYDLKQKHIVRAIAYGQVSEICKRMAAPFIDMNMAITGKRDSTKLGSADLKAFSANENRKALRGLNLAQAPIEDTGFESWNESYLEFIRATYVERAFQKQLWQTVLIWVPYLDAEAIAIASRLSEHQYLRVLESIRPYSNEPQKLDWKKKVGVSYFYDNNSSDVLLAEHESFLLALAQLWEIAEKRRSEAKAP